MTLCCFHFILYTFNSHTENRWVLIKKNQPWKAQHLLHSFTKHSCLFYCNDWQSHFFFKLPWTADICGFPVMFTGLCWLILAIHDSRWEISEPAKKKKKISYKTKRRKLDEGWFHHSVDVSVERMLFNQVLGWTVVDYVGPVSVYSTASALANISIRSAVQMTIWKQLLSGEKRPGGWFRMKITWN